VKIGIDARPLSYPLTGIGVYLANLLDHLQSVDRQNQYVLMSNAPLRYRIVNPAWGAIHGKVAHKVYSTVWYLGIVPVLAKRLQLDLFWGPRHHLPPFLPKRIRTVVTVHDVVHRLMPGTMTAANRLTERALMGSSVNRADRVAADSLSTAADLRRIFKLPAGKVATVYPGVPDHSLLPGDDRRQPGVRPPSGRRYFLFVGSLEPRKNLWRVLDGFALAAKRYPDIDLVIAGGGGWKNQALGRRIRHHRGPGQIHMTGYVAASELAHLYRHAHGLVFPSLYEGFGFPVVEAMAAGLPVIGSNRGSLAEVIASAGLRVDPRDRRAIGRAMIRLAADPELHRKLAAAGIANVRRFSWKRCADTMMRVFKEAAGHEDPAGI
jgi:glycosyltransferase involved in cell wall biosynthesis